MPTKIRAFIPQILASLPYFDERCIFVNYLTKVKTPDYLSKGDTIGIIAPVRKVSAEEIEPAVRAIEAAGFKAKLGANIFSSLHQFGGTDAQRASDLMQMVEDPSVKAILCSRGGYGSVRLLNLLNFESIQRLPKWLCGYSDITVLHALYNKLGVSSIHSTMPINFPHDGAANASITSLFDMLTGKRSEIKFGSDPLNISGKAVGELFGGNISLIYSMSGTEFQYDGTDKILFFEDLDEYLYHIDRMMWNLEMNGTLPKLKGVVVGYLSDMHDNDTPFGKNAKEIVYEHVAKYNIPLAFGLPVGHEEPNLALKFGAKYTLEVNAGGSELKEI